jgi:hypothetical protein
VREQLDSANMLYYMSSGRALSPSYEYNLVTVSDVALAISNVGKVPIGESGQRGMLNGALLKRECF